MPWQRLVADIGSELLDDGRPAYREVIVTVPRQSGKTTLVLAWEVHRAIVWAADYGPQRIAYSAQTGNDARKKLIEDQVPMLAPHKKALGIDTILKGMGNESIVFDNGSRIVLLASGSDSGHGKTIDLGVRDEFFADMDDRRDQALIPAMATRRFAQVLTTSTMGTDESVPLNNAVDRGRRVVEQGLREGTAYFEWSASWDDDPDDPATWERCMPALGLTISEGVVRHARSSLSDGEFRRAFLNLPTRSDDRVIPHAAWEAINDAKASPAGSLVFGIDIHKDRASASIVAASRGAHPVAELVESRAGVGWLVERVREMHDRWGQPTWIIDTIGPAGSVIPELEAAGVPVRGITSRELVEACGSFYDGVLEGRFTVRRHIKLDEAVAAAARRSVGDAWAWTRKHATADVSPLVAATLAVWGAQRIAEVDPVSQIQ